MALGNQLRAFSASACAAEGQHLHSAECEASGTKCASLRLRYVKFEKATWQLDGASEPGLYPVELKKRAWFVDAKRKKPVLKVKRQQIPLVPAFAITAHAMRSRYDVLIMRPFPLWLFQRGAAEGPKLLLASLRGQEIDWRAYREARQPTATCRECRLVKAFQAFAEAEWSQVRSNQPATCLACTNKGKPKAGPGEAQVFWRPCQLRLQRMQESQDRRCFSTCSAQSKGRRNQAPVLALPPSCHGAHLHRLQIQQAGGRVRSHHGHSAGRRGGVQCLPRGDQAAGRHQCARRLVHLQGLQGILQSRTLRLATAALRELLLSQHEGNESEVPQLRQDVPASSAERAAPCEKLPGLPPAGFQARQHPVRDGLSLCTPLPG